MIQNNGEYTINCNKFIVYSFINKLLFTKPLIIYDSA